MNTGGMWQLFHKWDNHINTLSTSLIQNLAISSSLIENEKRK